MTIKLMVLRALPIALVTVSTLGCSAEMLDGESSDGEPIDSVTQDLTGPTVFFQSYTYTQSNGGAAVERYADCSPDQVLTGLGARVSNDTLTDLTIYCRDILADGQLSVNESFVTIGGPSEEKNLHAANGSVIVGFGAIVTSDSVFRLVFRTCPWLPASKRIDIINCSSSSTTPGSFSTEQFLDTHAGLSAADKPRTVASGAGFTSTRDNVFAVRMSNGLLR